MATTEVFESNKVEYSTLKNAALGAMSRLESAALQMAFSSVNYDDPGDMHTPGEYSPIDINELPTISDVMSSINDVEADPFPTAPQADEIAKYKKHVWEDTHLDLIQTTLTTYMESMGVPSQGFQDAVFNEDRERKERILADKLDHIAAITSARGFKYANIQTAALIKDAIDIHGDNLEELNRKITTIITDWARQNLQFAIQQGISVEQAHMDFAYKYSSIFREMYQTQLNGVLEKFRAQVQMELAKIDGIMRVATSRAEVLKFNGSITAMEDDAWFKRNQLEQTEALQKYQHDISEFRNRAEMQIGAASNWAKTAASLVGGVTSSVVALSPK